MLVKTPLYTFWKNTVAKGLKMRRLRFILDCAGLTNANKPLKILEIGCANGKDVLQFLSDGQKYQLTGVDIIDSKIAQDNFTFVKCDASALPFEDNSFDLVLTVGLLEHIEPMEKLAAVCKEVARVGKTYVNVMPSVSTFLEPHAVRVRWPLKLHKHMVHKHSQKQILHLNFLSDHTWTKFEGFAEADVKRFWYLFPFVRNTVVYKR